MPHISQHLLSGGLAHATTSLTWDALSRQMTQTLLTTTRQVQSTHNTPPTRPPPHTNVTSHWATTHPVTTRSSPSPSSSTASSLPHAHQTNPKHPPHHPKNPFIFAFKNPYNVKTSRSKAWELLHHSKKMLSPVLSPLKSAAAAAAAGTAMAPSVPGRSRLFAM